MLEQARLRQALDEPVDVGPGPGPGHSAPPSRNAPATTGKATARSTRSPGGRPGMNVPALNWMPRNSASGGMGTVDARVSGPAP